MNKQQMNAFLDSKASLLSEISDKIWDYAETAFEEFESAELLCREAESLGFTVERPFAKIDTAFCASWGSGAPVIGILAEYDALSGLSQCAATADKRALKPGANGHGCGHNLFGAAALGAAAAVKEYLSQNGLQGTIKLFGCPGEEGGSGKAFMAREGAFQGLDAAFAWHPSSLNSVMDRSYLANYQVLYRFKGVAAHAAGAPHLGRSALDAVELMNVGVNFLREHVIQEARIHYAITNSGGFSPNVVQPEAEVLYLMRAPKTPQVEEIFKRINKIAAGAAMMTETELEIRFIKACANVIPNSALSDVMYRNLAGLPMPEYTAEEKALAASIAATCPPRGDELEHILTGVGAAEKREIARKLSESDICGLVIPYDKNAPDRVGSGSTDVGDVSWNVPTAQVNTACYALGTPGHSWQLVAQSRTSIGHKGMMLAAKTMAGAAVDAIESPEVIKAAWGELRERLGGESYKSAIPADVKPVAISKL